MNVPVVNQSKTTQLTQTPNRLHILHADGIVALGTELFPSGYDLQPHNHSLMYYLQSLLVNEQRFYYFLQNPFPHLVFSGNAFPTFGFPGFL